MSDLEGKTGWACSRLHLFASMASRKDYDKARKPAGQTSTSVWKSGVAVAKTLIRGSNTAGRKRNGKAGQGDVESSGVEGQASGLEVRPAEGLEEAGEQTADAGSTQTKEPSAKRPYANNTVVRR